MVLRYTPDELASRHSVRKYAPVPVAPEVAAILDSEVEEINASYPGIRFVICYDSPEAFSSLRKTYGLFSGVSNYLVAVVDGSVGHAAEIAGFAAEQFVMRATRCGLGTCFVGATFDGSKLAVGLNEGEKVLFVVSFGYEAKGGEGLWRSMMRRIVRSKMLPPADFYTPGDGDLSFAEAAERMPLLEKGLEAVAVAPSARNRQPVRFRMGADGVLRAATIVENAFSDVDFGIAKFNFQAVAGGRWDWGRDGGFQMD